MENKKLRAVVYTRVSSTRSRKSLIFQTVCCSTQAFNDNVQVIDFVRETDVTTKGNSQSIELLLKYAREKKYDVLYVSSVDRISRHLGVAKSFISELAKNNVRVYSIEEETFIDEKFFSTPKLLVNELSKQTNYV